MECFCGTSGFSFKEWHGAFYPIDLPEKQRLEFYSANLNAVEINNSFYRLPKRDQLKSWAAQTPESFRFVIKATRRISHQKRLLNAEEPMAYLMKNVAVLGERLGAVLIQLPPNMRANLERLQSFLSLCDDDIPIAFEFRHTSWRDEKVFACLREKNAAWVMTDDDGLPEPIFTADWSYQRLRRLSSDGAELEAWKPIVEAGELQRSFTFLKHELPAAPELAAKFAGYFETPQRREA